MANSSPLADIKSLIQSFHPLFVLETVEEERALGLLKSVAAELRLPLFDWSVTRGLKRLPDGSTIYGTAEPLVALKHIESLTQEGIFHLPDFSTHLQSPVVIRALREVCE